MSDIKCEICNGNKEDENNNTLCGACTQQIENGAREAVEELETTDGYDTRLFVNSLPAYCECSVCNGAVRDPVQIEDCGHVYCASCLQTWIDRQDEPTCPNDRVVITNSFTDRSMRRVVMAMQVKCDHDQCLWKGDLHDRIQHLKRNCQHIRIRCIKDRCESVLARYELVEHIKNLCIYRSCNCLYCNRSVMFCETENHHATDCEMFPIDCQYKCQQKIPRRQLAAHENDCTERPLLCSFHHIGCLFQGKKSLLDVHLKDAVNYHLQKTVETMNQQNVVSQQQIETLKIENNELRANFERTTEERKQQDVESQQQIKALQNKTQQQIKALKIENNELRTNFRRLQRQ